VHAGMFDLPSLTGRLLILHVFGYPPIDTGKLMPLTVEGRY
jgi:hypothetical protein